MGISSTDFAYLRELLYHYSGIVLDEDKEYLAELHLEPLAEIAGFDSIATLIKFLRTEPFNSLHVQVIEALVTYETFFFRDIYPFEALKNFVLPELLKNRKEEKSLNIWCAACSSGQEPYSIAMLIRQYFPMLANWMVKIIASDFSSKALARARKGRYNQIEIQRGLSETLRNKYFHQENNEWQIQEQIRSLVEFREMNLIQSWSFLPQMDIIFLRNVLIYFDTEMKKTILGKVRQLLKPDGYLFLGGGETTIYLDSSFKQVKLGKYICYRN
ncbi:MAG: protein-glutamate O-methyltransferase CheR [Stigonema ocellatum SAG 48.90 = DSM 106950]|nr:protein-glutamate O-methyltransferase CheR [Stigonema ocellatum SAG 48.90 = DSM 106950]